LRTAERKNQDIRFWRVKKGGITMAQALKLNKKQQALYESVKRCMEQLQAHYRDPKNLSSSDFKEVYAEMASKAHKLHKLLKADGKEPKHHKYMLENRGVSVDDEEFYNHLHPVEDLIAFVNDPDVNNDPEDSTIGARFNFRVYTRRWGHYDNYSIVRNDSGWIVSFMPSAPNVNSDKKGIPGLFDALDHDSVCYPQHIDDFFEWIWEKAADGADKATVQDALDKIADWISICEKSTPSDGILEGLI
jgi:hypothetical protein